VFGGTAEQLRSFDINIGPPEDVWVLVDEENGIWFKQVGERSTWDAGVEDRLLARLVVQPSTLPNYLICRQKQTPSAFCWQMKHDNNNNKHMPVIEPTSQEMT